MPPTRSARRRRALPNIYTPPSTRRTDRSSPPRNMPRANRSTILPRARAQDREIRITTCLASVNRISSVLSSAISSEDAQEFFTLARSAIASFDQLDYMNDLGRTTEQVAVLNTLQNLAYLNADEGGIRDIADWCLRQWLTVLNRDQECLEALQGIGRSWLYRAQQNLSVISALEHSPTLTTSSSSNGQDNVQQYSQDDYERDAEESDAHASMRLNTGPYVEARGILLPATEFLARAVSIADRRVAAHQQALAGDVDGGHDIVAASGELLAQAAEAFMSLGNVSFHESALRYFNDAVIYLRRANETPDYELAPYLQRWLDEYGRLAD